jgi:HPr kinase/phosphorylase
MLLHGSCAALAGEAVLFLAPPGGGKSDLLLRLIERGWRLVADDQVALRPEGGVAMAAPPPALAGMLELRGLGLVTGLDWAAAPLRLVARLTAPDEVPRLPQPESWTPAAMTPAAVTLPLIRLDPWAASAPDRLAVALRVLGGRLRMASGAFAA